MFWKKFGYIIFFVIQANGEFEGEQCTKDGMIGVCRKIRQCKTAIDDIRNHRGTPKICSFSSNDPIICCMDNPVPMTQQPPLATTSTASLGPITEYIPPEYDYALNEQNSSSPDACEPLASIITAPKTGQKAWDKCIEYQEKLVYPCERDDLTGTLRRYNKCKRNAEELIIYSSVRALRDEFSHMALIGFGSEDSVQWLCSGTLLSERFILTAAHCTSNRYLGNVSYVRLGALRRTEALDLNRVYKVRNIIKHPDFKPPKIYNDVALLEVDRDMLLDESAVPACLDVGGPNNYDRALATGWGATQNQGVDADQLLKVFMRKMETSKCSNLFSPSKLMMKGFDEKTQLCYGDTNISKDTCQGDSGGPLQIKHKQIYCMYTVIGVTSFGRACGFVGEPGIYTRVAAYVPWIESIVWPSSSSTS